MTYHLAQVNIARLLADLEDPRMAGLVSRVEEMNRVADMAEGFIWRLPGKEADAESLRKAAKYLGDTELARVFYNLSIWESPEHLRRYVYQTRHKEMLHGKHSWIEEHAPKAKRAVMALWWIPIHYRPTIAESMEKLWSVSNNGPTKVAFTLTRTFPPPALINL